MLTDIFEMSSIHSSLDSLTSAVVVVYTSVRYVLTKYFITGYPKALSTSILTVVRVTMERLDFVMRAETMVLECMHVA